MYRCVVKPVIDFLLCLVALPFFGLALLIIAPMIYFDDPGPVFYNATRVGKDRKLYKMYKFRTMKVNSPDLKMPDGSTYNAPDDPRVTKIGAWLRKTSLDELPQILNVLKWQMSLIGPRPDLQNEVELYFAGEERKLAVKPGISGYAQVYGRNSIAWHERIALDVFYVEHLSFGLDARLFFKTFGAVFSQTGIYVEAGASDDVEAGVSENVEAGDASDRSGVGNTPERAEALDASDNARAGGPPEKPNQGDA